MKAAFFGRPCLLLSLLLAASAAAAQPGTAPAGAAQPTIPAPAEEGGAPALLRAALSDATYSQSASAPLLLKVDYASPAGAPASRPPLNIALVLDRSRSMAEDKKFGYALDAAREVVANLSDRDVVSLVAFNERVLVLSPAGRAVNKPFLFHRFEEITPEGYTDLSAGLLEGIAQVNSQSGAGQIRQVFLLTDGKANRGVTKLASLRKIADKARAKGVGLSTLGVGADFDEKLLTELASAGGGRYAYVRSPEQIPDAFKAELHGLLEVAAQNARLEIAIEQGSIAKVFGQVWDRAAPSYQINIGNLRAGERGTVLLALQPADYKPGTVVRATAKLTFDDPQAGERVVRVAAAQAACAPDAGGRKTGENEEVAIYGGLLRALEAATEGAEGFDRQRHRQARADFAQWHGRAHQFALRTQNQDLLNHTFLLKHLLAEMEAEEAQGKMHDHAEAGGKLKKEADYQRYLLFHHREPR
ncbi:MAG: VWA domain-containing protein [Opitutae bacterium]|nr:VWA domain-containing protein [Opitutae bacterium]